GSEGTLGVVTEIVVKLIPLPRYRAAAMIGYQRLEEAAEAVSRVLASGHFPAALEIMDHNAIQLLVEYLPEGFKPGLDGVLIVEQDGNDQARVQEDLAQIAELLGGVVRVVARNEEEREALWVARRHFGQVLMSRRKNFFAED